MKPFLQRLTGPWPAATLVLFVSYLCGLSAFFPYDALRPRLEAAAAKRGVQLTVGEMAAAFPLGITARHLRIGDPAAGDERLTLAHLKLHPTLFSLVRGNPAVAVDAGLYRGTISGTIARDGAFDLKGEGIELQSPLVKGGEGRLSGRLLRATLLGAYPPTPRTTTRIEIVIDEARLDGLSAFGSSRPLALGRVTVRLSGQGPSLRCETVEATGGQLTVSGEGTLLLSSPLRQSPLNLTLRLRPAAGLDPALAVLLTALLPPGGDGSSLLRLGGTLAAPRKL